jgi:hypothetical protein
VTVAEMPRSGSKAQLIHLLADSYAYAMSEVYGEHLPPSAYYELFQGYDRKLLEDSAANLEPSKVGRPRRASSLVDNIDTLMSIHGRGVLDACRRYHRKHFGPYQKMFREQPSHASEEEREKAARTLAKRYYREKKRLQKV